MPESGWTRQASFSIDIKVRMPSSWLQHPSLSLLPRYKALRCQMKIWRPIGGEVEGWHIMITITCQWQALQVRWTYHVIQILSSGSTGDPVSEIKSMLVYSAPRYCPQRLPAVPYLTNDRYHKKLTPARPILKSFASHQNKQRSWSLYILVVMFSSQVLPVCSAALKSLNTYLKMERDRKISLTSRNHHAA